MITLASENYSENLIPKKYLRVHFDGINYYFAETKEDELTIETMLSIPEIEPEIEQEIILGTALQAVLTATPEELIEIKKILGITN